MSRQVRGFLTVLGLGSVMLLWVCATPAAPYAQAGNCAAHIGTAGILCGEVTNRSSTPVTVTDNYGCNDIQAGCGNREQIVNGQKSSFEDTDAFYINPGCRYEFSLDMNFTDAPEGPPPLPATDISSGWKKVNDNERYIIEDIKC